jgi:hypothetical protein
MRGRSLMTMAPGGRGSLITAPRTRRRWISIPDTPTPLDRQIPTTLFAWQRTFARFSMTIGFPKAESILSEWNLTPDFTILEAANLQGAHNAAYIGAVLSYFQDAPIDHAHFLSWRCGMDGIVRLEWRLLQNSLRIQSHGQDTGYPAPPVR